MHIVGDCDHLVQEKSRTRAGIIKKKQLMEEEKVLTASEIISERLFGMPQLLRADIVFCYVSIEGEVQTHSLIEKLLELGKRVCVPKCYKNGVMESRFISSLATLDSYGPFRILEPHADAEVVDPSMIDFAIDPGLAFDNNGNRLGRGAGYYDRYLKSIGAFKCGVCFDEMIVDSVPVGAYDIQMDVVVTEENIYLIEKTEGFNASTTKDSATAV